MINKVNFKIEELENMKKYPSELFYIGKKELLKKKKISIIGTRRPNSYTKEFTHKLAHKLSSLDICIVSGAAMGVDAISHLAAKPENTIAVVANGLDIRYPSVNKNLISNIEQKGLVLSAYKEGEKARNYTFVLRNEIVVALGDILIVTQADLNSGSLTSVQYALKMKKKIYTLPHRIGESLGTQELVKKGLIEPIYDIDEFISQVTNTNKIEKTKDEFLLFCESSPSYEEAILKFGNRVLEYELEGKIVINNARVSLS
ncbi:DNA-processing protein DprA [Poseidonibacter ostreae]|jgi:DNA processing protein|uniref:DNA-processing protein DprA n=1 Tax=Poseidonibacter ostreae TaxID=2654171 RepID=A0A6L4WQ08_9BACT|nr:DNA-processing protein DprA [Poseidonibacter ostreae]KAB7886363.1 DNA-processing protein DprA [Poseidonibacter ostreae]KAB7887478.1 DNA-processing protein DprA [Poseidonibacter ostreae]KAB7891858.1 DNA-processing protein DprA [Poseidonibacter ostreae]MAC82831.1 DNA processing protein DprA [Arcobacter sp.]|tara:strand:- start:3108 stop:3884 length:777 start_codon:yes stop_codon:yes gene_type:complete